MQIHPIIDKALKDHLGFSHNNNKKNDGFKKYEYPEVRRYKICPECGLEYYGTRCPCDRKDAR